MNEPRTSAEELWFETARNLNRPEDRAAFLDQCCGGDAVLRARLDLLLQGHFAAEEFLADLPTTPPATPDPLPVGRYDLIEKVGEGGFGEVWVAEQREPVRRRVAFKIIKAGMDTRQVIARFEVERQTLALMNHPHIATVLDAGATEAGRPYFVMELVPGSPITEFCDRHRLGIRERLELFIPVCQAVQHAHQKGIIHRDLKPSNLLVMDRDGAPVPKVIDFGIAKATQGRLAGQHRLTQGQPVLGTPAYLSPEQAEGGADIDTRSDVYSLGAVLYELLTGFTPFDERDWVDGGIEALRLLLRERQPLRPGLRLARNRGGAATRPAIDPDLDWIVMKCLESDRARRYETANGLALDLRRFLAHEPVLARPPGAAYQTCKFVRRHRLGFSLAGLIGLLLLWVLLLSLVSARREHRAALQLRHDLAVQFLVRGQGLNQQGDVARGLHWLAQALETAPEESQDLQSTIRFNLGSWAPRAQAPRAVLPHDGTARIVDWSPDGARWLTGSEDSTARLWRAGTAEPLGVPLRHGGALVSARFSPDGRQVLTLSRDRTARLWSSLDGSAPGPVWRHEGELTAAGFSPDGTRVVTASQDGKARLWSAISGEPLSPWLVLEGSVRAVAFVRDGREFVTADAAGRIRFWTGDRGEETGAPLVLDRGIRTLALSRDGRWLAAGSDGGEVQRWSVESRLPPGPPLHHRGRVNTVAFSPDGTRLVSGSSDGVARLWSVATGEPVGAELQHGAPVLVVAFTPDGRRVVTGSENNSAMVWSADTGERRVTIQHEGWVWSLAFSPDGRQLLTGADDHSAKLWSIAEESAGELVLNHGGVVKSAAFSPDGRWVVTGGQSNEVWRASARLWSAATGEPVRGVPHLGFVWTAGFSPDGCQLLTAGRDGVPRLWREPGWEPQSVAVRHPFDIRCAIFSRDGLKAATGGFDRSALIWSTQTGKPLLPRLEHPQYVEDVAFSPDGTVLATACGDGVVRLWSTETGERVGPTFRHRGSVLAVTFSPDGRTLLTGGADNTARFWDRATGALKGRALEHPAWVEDAAFSPDGTRVATGDAFDSAWLWSVATGELLAPPFHHRGPINELEFSPDGTRLLTASHDTTARIWRLPEPYLAPVAQVRRWVEAVTGKAMDGQGVLGWLDATEWRARRAEFGPPRGDAR